MCVVKPNVRTQPSFRSIFAMVARTLREMQIYMQIQDLGMTDNRKTMSLSANKMTETGFEQEGVAEGPTTNSFQLIYARVETIAGGIRIAMLCMTQEPVIYFSTLVKCNAWDGHLLVVVAVGNKSASNANPQWIGIILLFIYYIHTFNLLSILTIHFVNFAITVGMTF